MSFLKSIVAKYAEVTAVRLPSVTDKIYRKQFKLPKRSGTVSIFNAHGDEGKIAIYLFPEWTKEDHLAAAARFKKLADKYSKEWAKAADEAHKKAFDGKEREFHDYKVSGIGRDEYAEDDKNKLRKLNRNAFDAKALAKAHEKAAKLVGRIKVHKMSEEDKKKG